MNTTPPQNVTTVQQSSAPANPNVTKTVDQILGSVQTELAKDPQVFDQSLATPAGATTQAGWNSTLTAANNPGYTSALSGAISDYGDIASGKRYGTDDPGYATLRANAANDAQELINGQFNSSNRFGGGSHVEKLGEGVTSALAGLDYGNFLNDQQRQAQALQLLPGAYQSSLLPGAAQTGVGSAMDANTQSILLGQNDLFRRKADAKLNQLGQGTSLLAGNANASGTNSSSTSTSPGTPQTPLWQSLLGGAIGLGSFL